MHEALQLVKQASPNPLTTSPDLLSARRGDGGVPRIHARILHAPDGRPAPLLHKLGAFCLLPPRRGVFRFIILTPSLLCRPLPRTLLFCVCSCKKSIQPSRDSSIRSLKVRGKKESFPLPSRLSSVSPLLETKSLAAKKWKLWNTGHLLGS